MASLSGDTLQGLRFTLAPEYAVLPDENLEELLRESIASLPADSAENFLKSLGSFGKSITPVLQQALPIVAKVAPMAGPYGMAIGLGANLLSCALGGGRKPAMPAAGPPGAMPPAAGPAGLSGMPALPTGQGAAATFMSLLQNPSIQQALMSQVMGRAGATQVPTGTGGSVPTGVINSLLSQLLTNASDALNVEGNIEGARYLQGAYGEYLVDPASPEQQAALVLSMLRRRPKESVAEWDFEFDGDVEFFAEDTDSVESGDDWEEFGGDYGEGLTEVEFY